MINYIKSSIQDSISTKESLLSNSDILSSLENVATAIYSAVKGGNKVMVCGNGGSAADAQHIVAELVGRFIYERKALPAIALTTDSSILTAVGNDYGFDAIFERQVEALAQKGDVLIGISTSGNSKNVVKAIERAKELGVTTVALLGADGGVIKTICDYPIIVSSPTTARVQESHILLGHIICGVIDELIKREGKNKAIFLDRDGTINIDYGYISKIENLKFIDGVITALKKLQSAGFKIIIITNQSGIGRGYFTEEQYKDFNNDFVKTLSKNGIVIDDILTCPHDPKDECHCRKPLPYLINKAIDKHNINREKSVMLGDKTTDVECGKNANIRSFQVTENENLLYWTEKMIKEKK